MTVIDNSAFYDCRVLTEIVIPNSVETMGYEVFNECKNLTIYVEAGSRPNGWQTSWNPSKCTVVWGYNDN